MQLEPETCADLLHDRAQLSNAVVQLIREVVGKNWNPNAISLRVGRRENEFESED
ncbi:unnamed protein product, partial [Nesidiocoris tenuis]